jgi:hypothetical protein
VLWAILGAIAVFGDYGSVMNTVYSILAGVLLATTLVDQAFGPYAHRRDEQTLRAVSLVLFPLVLGAHLAMWRFIDGAGFFLGMVMPMNTDHLRPLCTGFLGVFSLLAAYQFAAIRNTTRTAVATTQATVAAPIAEETRKAA